MRDHCEAFDILCNRSHIFGHSESQGEKTPPTSSHEQASAACALPELVRKKKTRFRAKQYARTSRPPPGTLSASTVIRLARRRYAFTHCTLRAVCTERQLDGCSAGLNAQRPNLRARNSCTCAAASLHGSANAPRHASRPLRLHAQTLCIHLPGAHDIWCLCW